jgi:hypothetical protein
MAEFPHQMRMYLLKIDHATWQQIRAQVRWRYAKHSWIPPRRLVRFMDFLPEHPKEWADYAKEITQTRRIRAAEAATAKRKAKQKRALKVKRDYQKNYMREYRHRLRHGTL